MKNRLLSKFLGIIILSLIALAGYCQQDLGKLYSEIVKEQGTKFRVINGSKGQLLMLYYRDDESTIYNELCTIYSIDEKGEVNLITQVYKYDQDFYKLLDIDFDYNYEPITNVKGLKFWISPFYPYRITMIIVKNNILISYSKNNYK